MAVACNRKVLVRECKSPGNFVWLVSGFRDEPGKAWSHRPIAEGERPTHLWLIEPDGRAAKIAIRPEVQLNGASWEWDGDLEKPTLSPSINAGKGGWHGWLRAGEMTDA